MAVRRLLAVLLLVLVGLVVTAPPVAAAKAPPWRFVTITGSVNVPGQTSAPWIGQCPAGYTAVTGGFQAQGVGVVRSLEYPTHADGTYHLILRNGGGSTQSVSVTAYCAHRDDIDLGVSASAVFNRNGSGRAFGTLSCPDGYGILTGGVDWATTGTAEIDWSSPTPLGDAWFVSGYSSGAGGQIGIEIFCMPDALLGGQYQVVTSTTTEAGSDGVKVATATCPLGKHLVTGGSYGKPTTAAFSAADTGYSWHSSPAFASLYQWKASAFVTAGSALTAVAICIPASQPTAGITGTSPDLTNDRRPDFTPVGTDAAGETVITTCAVDGGQFYSCPNGTPTQFPTQVADGTHQVIVHAVNTSQQTDIDAHNWTVDGTAPTVADFGGGSGVPANGPISVTFSELVQGASSSTVTVKSDLTTTVPGSVTTQTSGSQTVARWTPTSPLTLGKTYQVAIVAGITDLAGNTLQPTSENVVVTPDVSVPTAAITAAGSPTQLALGFPVSWTGTDTGTGVASYDVQYRKAAWNSGFGSPVRLRSATTATSLGFVGVAGTQYCFAVRSRDGAGNTSAWSAQRCAAIPLDDRALSRSRGWKMLTGAGYFRSTVLLGRTKALKLTRSGVPAGRVALIAIRGPGSGSVQVRYNGVVVATVRLRAARTSRAVIMLPNTKGLTKITFTTTTRAQVRIDGLLLARK